MTIELFIGGLMILTLVAGVVIAMTTSRNTNTRRFDGDFGSASKGRIRNTSKH